MDGQTHVISTHEAADELAARCAGSIMHACFDYDAEEARMYLCYAVAKKVIYDALMRAAREAGAR